MFPTHSRIILTACTAGIVALLLITTAASVQASGRDLALREARLAEAADDREGAAGAYAAWLAGHSDSPAASLAFAHYLRLEQDFPALLASGTRFLRSSNPSSGGPSPFEKMARLFEVAGRPVEARDAYLAAYDHGATLSAVEAAFLLSLEMNDLDAMTKCLARLKNTENGKADFLHACLSWQKGDAGPAIAALQRIADDNSSSDLSLKALWMSYQIAARSADPRARMEASRKLGARFPRSPEYALTMSGDLSSGRKNPARVVTLPDPGAFFSGPAGEQPQSETPAPPVQPAVAEPAPAELSTPPAEPVPPPAGTLSVQAGSFQMKENADDLVQELTRKGFSAALRIDSIQGKPLYRVLAGSALGTDAARELLDKLHAAGFSGFLLKDR